MTYKLSTIASILGVKVNPVRGGELIATLLTDSRSLTVPEKSMFFALKTAGNDGHRYISDLYNRGVRYFVVEYRPSGSNAMRDAVFLQVPSVIEALQAIGRHHRSRFDIPVVAITGSRGKTIVKEWLFQMLHYSFKIVRSPRSYNSQIGVPLSVWEMNPQTNLAIFEAGISVRGEMDALASIIRPTIGVLTNITKEHDDGFDDRRQKCIEKARLLRNCQRIIYNADDPLIASVVLSECPLPRKIGWSISDVTSPLYIRGLNRRENGTVIYYSFNHREGEMMIPFTTDNDVENAVTSLAIMLSLGQPRDYIAARMSSLSHVDTRLNVTEGVNNCMLIYDDYTCDMNSLVLALDFMNRRTTATRTSTVILSDPQHESTSLDSLYQSCAKMLKLKGVSRMIGIGPEMMSHRNMFDIPASFYQSTDAFLEEASPGDFNNELILIKGGARFRFDRLATLLEAKHQETVLEVNLDAIVHNYNYYRSLMPPQTGVVGMVKASAYGAGSLEVAKTLQSQGAAYLAVAVLDEGVALRKAGITMPIMVLNPRVLNYRTLFAYNLEPEIYSFDILLQVIAEGEKWDVEQYPVHIKLDTGMHRLGFVEEELPRLIEVLKSQKFVAPESVFSHLATADCLDQDEYTMCQLDTFDRCCDKLQQHYKHHIKRHILNTAGIARFASMRSDDMCRLGIGLYGVEPIEGDGSRNHLQTVSTLSTIITSLRKWGPGTAIGYSRRGVLDRSSVIATLPIGYADGINRRLGNGQASFMVNGHLCPTVGNICMDSCMIDVTDVECRVGDTVEIFGSSIPVEDVAKALDTIPYEVLTSVSERVKRIYYRE